MKATVLRVRALFKALVIVSLFMGCAAGGATGEHPAGPPEGNDSPRSFAVFLYKALKVGQGNLTFSPSSISSVLAMAYDGARGTTREQMAAVLHFPLDSQRFHGFLTETATGSTRQPGQDGITLNTANALWGQSGYPFLQGFLNDLKTFHLSELRRVDFSGQTEAARSAINGWVQEKTAGLIRDLIGPGVLTPETRLVLTNAIYFKGLWAAQFSRQDTRTGRFILSSKDAADVDMMEQTGDFRYLETADMKILEMPYSGSRLSMVVVLPETKGGLSKVEGSLSPSVLGKWMDDIDGANPVQVRVRLPRFKVSAEFDLSRTLSRMGMPEAFGDAADFSGMTGSRGLFISNVIHKAFVEVNEEGTEAAAASAVIMTKSMHMVREFHADHPFLFLIREHRTGSILFMGRVTDPRP
ncbi:MAG TPA: serpin family protein [Deltaproteobacteria bacterium]|nr:serpin family protein [Deltaproteobacteria bacterium]